MKTREVNLPEVVGKGYGTFWNYKGRYRVVKGSRASKKSTTVAMNMIYRIMKYPDSNGLVIRKVYGTLKDSCFAQLKWAIHRLGVEKYWRATVSPLTLTYIPTGQKIIFRGLDDPFKITSVTVDRGVLCFLWIEEAYEILKEDDFNTIDESIRGQVPDHLFKQITISLNPWNERHWIKRRFFDYEDDDILAITTNYKINEWLDKSDRKIFERMKTQNPTRYRVAGLGEWGVVEGLVFENWREERFDIEEVKGEYIYALDFGYTNDPTAFFCGKIDTVNKRLYVFNEFYDRRMSNEKIAEKITALGFHEEKIVADSAEPKSIARLKTLGINRMRPARKGADSVKNGIDFLQDYEIIVDPKCVNFITEISLYTWDEDREGNLKNKPVDYMNHLMDAMRYACEPYMRNKTIHFD